MDSAVKTLKKLYGVIEFSLQFTRLILLQCKACSMTTGDVPPAGPVEGATCDDSTVDTLVKVDQMEESAKSLTVDTEINIRQPLCEAEEVEREEDSSPQLPETLSVNAITNYLCTDGRENGLTQKLLPANSFIWRGSKDLDFLLTDH